MIAQRAHNSRVMVIRFGAKIRARRAELDLSQDEVAIKAGLHRNTVGRIEKRAVTLDDIETKELIALAHALNWTPEQLEQLAPPALEVQRLGLEIPAPLYVELRARFPKDQELHDFCVSAIEGVAKADGAKSAPTAEPAAEEAESVTTHRAKNGLIVARVKRQKRVRGSRG